MSDSTPSSNFYDYSQCPKYNRHNLMVAERIHKKGYRHVDQNEYATHATEVTQIEEITKGISDGLKIKDPSEIGAKNCCFNTCKQDKGKLPNWPGSTTTEYCCDNPKFGRGGCQCRSFGSTCSSKCHDPEDNGMVPIICCNSYVQLPRELEVRLLNEVNPALTFGVFAMEKIPKGCLLIEYVGAIYEEQEWQDSTSNKDYGLHINRDKHGPWYVIDARIAGNEARYVNHSCEDDNCCVVQLEKENYLGVFLMSTKEIDIGDQICFKYEREMKEGQGLAPTQCKCRPNCPNQIVISALPPVTTIGIATNSITSLGMTRGLQLDEISSISASSVKSPCVSQAQASPHGSTVE